MQFRVGRERNLLRLAGCASPLSNSKRSGIAAPYLPRVDITEEGLLCRRLYRSSLFRICIVIHIRKVVINDPFFISGDVPSARNYTEMVDMNV